MQTAVEPITQLIILGACCSASAAVYTAVAPLVRAIVCHHEVDVDRWQRGQTRWSRLRVTSALFRSGERYIVGLANLIEYRLPWLVALPVETKGVRRLFVTLCASVFGRTSALDEAARMRATEQPWAASEVVSTAVMLAAFCALVSAMVLMDFVTGFGLAATGAAIGLAVYRYWIWRFVMQAQLRRRTIRRFLPHAIDSIAMVMNSGDPFRSGLETVIRDFPIHPLSHEFVRLRNDLERGQSMQAALESTARAICLPEFDELVRVLGRVHEHGVPATENFNRMAKQLRATHLRHMEEEVGRAEASLSFPTMCVMAACMIVALAPFVLSILQSDLLD